MCNGWVMLDIVEPTRNWSQGIASCVLELKAPAVEISSGEWFEKSLCPASVYSFSEQSALWDWWRVLPRGSWVLLVLRDSATASSERLVSHFSFYLMYHHGIKPLTAAVQEVRLSQFEPSLSLCVPCALSVFVLVRTLTEVNLLQHLEKITKKSYLSWSDSWVLAGLKNFSVRIKAANIIGYSTQSTIFCM